MIKKDIKRNTPITLSEDEQEIARFTAQKRADNNRRCNVRNNNFTNMTDFEIDLLGFGAELAFCKLFNIMPDFFIGARSAKDDKGDCEIDGRRIDVKCTRKDSGDLLVGCHKEKTVHSYALMTGFFPQYTFRGFFLADELFDEDRLIAFPGNYCYKADQAELKTWHALLLHESSRQTETNHRTLVSVL